MFLKNPYKRFNRYWWRFWLSEISPRTTWSRLSRLIDWLPVIWLAGEWDHSYIFRVWGKQFERMAALFSEGKHVCWQRQERELKICAYLCKRLAEEDYCDLDTYETLDMKTQYGVQRFRYLMKQEEWRHNRDLELLTNLVRRKSKTWWD